MKGDKAMVTVEFTETGPGETDILILSQETGDPSKDIRKARDKVKDALVGTFGELHVKQKEG